MVEDVLAYETKAANHDFGGSFSFGYFRCRCSFNVEYRNGHSQSGNGDVVEAGNWIDIDGSINAVATDCGFGYTDCVHLDRKKTERTMKLNWEYTFTIFC